MSYSGIIWQQDFTKLQGFVIKSPFSGQLLPINEHPQPLYHQAILPFSLCCKLQNGTIFAPFNAEFSSARDVDRRLVFKHQSGLTLTLDLPFALSHLHSKGMNWLNRPNQLIKAGCPVLQLDLPYLQLYLDDIYCVATLAGSTRFNKIYSRRAQVNANEDALFVLQLKEHSAE